MLEGCVRRVGDEMRINAQLIDGTNSGHLWAERFDKAWSDILTVQQEITENVAEALQLKAGSGQEGEARPGGTDVPAAYEVYLQGLDQKDGDAPVNKAKAASLFREAVRLDPDFGQAWAQLAWLYWANYGNQPAEKALETSNFEMIVRTREYLVEAEKRPSSLSYSLAADLLIYETKWEEAITAARRGVALDPAMPPAMKH